MSKHATDPSIAEVVAAIGFDASGLVPAIAQQHDTGEVLMLAWMNRDAVAETLATGRVCYWSRSRAALWRKGDTSGQVQRLVELRIDCDGDALLVLVDQTGVACHTGRRTCFFRAARDGSLREIVPRQVSPEALYPAPLVQAPESWKPESCKPEPWEPEGREAGALGRGL